MNALERLELELNSDPFDDFPAWLNGWQSDVFTVDTDEAFRALEHPPRHIIYDELSAPPTLVNKDTYPELRTDECPQMGVRQ